MFYQIYHDELKSMITTLVGRCSILDSRLKLKNNEEGEILCGSYKRVVVVDDEKKTVHGQDAAESGPGLFVAIVDLGRCRRRSLHLGAEPQTRRLLGADKLERIQRVLGQ